MECLAVFGVAKSAVDTDPVVIFDESVDAFPPETDRRWFGEGAWIEAILSQVKTCIIYDEWRLCECPTLVGFMFDNCFFIECLNFFKFNVFVGDLDERGIGAAKPLGFANFPAVAGDVVNSVYHLTFLVLCQVPRNELLQCFVAR